MKMVYGYGDEIHVKDINNAFSNNYKMVDINLSSQNSFNVSNSGKAQSTPATIIHKSTSTETKSSTKSTEPGKISTVKTPGEARTTPKPKLPKKHTTIVTDTPVSKKTPSTKANKVTEEGMYYPMY